TTPPTAATTPSSAQRLLIWGSGIFSRESLSDFMSIPAPAPVPMPSAARTGAMNFHDVKEKPELDDAGWGGGGAGLVGQPLTIARATSACPGNCAPICCRTCCTSAELGPPAFKAFMSLSMNSCIAVSDLGLTK